MKRGGSAFFILHPSSFILAVWEPLPAVFDRATHLRGKHEYYGPRDASLTDFIENVATRSSTTGQRYRVKLPSGDVVAADEWLRGQAAKLVGKPKEVDDDCPWFSDWPFGGHRETDPWRGNGNN